MWNGRRAPDRLPHSFSYGTQYLSSYEGTNLAVFHRSATHLDIHFGSATLDPTRIRRVRRDTTSRYGPGTLAEMEAALREDRGMAEDAVT